ncbi:enoyl-CoA hydratase-related protein [Profundibacter sp.]|uniref:enoyl-CoA hydratase-related protein n=1 Tax=Profundibacter sp. TaxID=3101071 RepID=UPI003D12B1C5
MTIITGAGDKALCPGRDLKAEADGDAVDGIACSCGLVLLFSCDLIVVADHTSFALSETRTGTITGVASPNRSIYCLRASNINDCTTGPITSTIFPTPDALG